jgi:hypothetical protein
MARLKPDILAAIMAEQDDRKLLRDVVDAVPALAQHGTNQHSEGPDNVRSSAFGNSAAYLIAKLKRDAPEFAERLAAEWLRIHNHPPALAETGASCARLTLDCADGHSVPRARGAVATSRNCGKFPEFSPPRAWRGLWSRLTPIAPAIPRQRGLARPFVSVSFR